MTDKFKKVEFPMEIHSEDNNPRSRSGRRRCGKVDPPNPTSVEMKRRDESSAEKSRRGFLTDVESTAISDGKCLYCGKVYKRKKADLLTHMKSKCPSRPRETPVTPVSTHEYKSSEKKDLVCPWCSRSCTAPQGLARHVISCKKRPAHLKEGQDKKAAVEQPPHPANEIKVEGAAIISDVIGETYEEAKSEVRDASFLTQEDLAEGKHPLRASATSSTLKPQVKARLNLDEIQWTDLDHLITQDLGKWWATRNHAPIDELVDSFSNIIYQSLMTAGGQMVVKKEKRVETIVRKKPDESTVVAKLIQRARYNWKRDKSDGKKRQEFYKLLRLHAYLKREESRAKNTTPKEGRVSDKEQQRFEQDPVAYASSRVMNADTSGAKPTFDESKCFEYFKKTYQDEERCTNEFTWPSWIPHPQQPNNLFDSRAISLDEMRKILSKKSNGSSPGPDGIPYLVWKKLPSTHAYIVELFNLCMEKKRFPRTWKIGVTILLHKSGATDDPSNFRPICLTNSIGKLFTSILLERLTKYAVDNKFINTSLQKGFLKFAGCWEHAFSLQVALQFSKNAQRNIVGCLIDLANAYGSVRHNLILAILHAYHFPSWFQHIIKDLYSDMATVYRTDDYITDPVPIEVGVFQGDPLSVGIFLMIINPVFTWLDISESTTHGFRFDSDTKMKMYALAALGFADDITVIARSADGAQFLLNGVHRFCGWSKMKIKLKKCLSFGTKRVDNRWVMYDPNLQLNSEKIPACLDTSQSGVRLLGRQMFLTIGQVKKIITKDFEDLLKKIDSLPILPLSKVEVYNICARWTFTWAFSIYELSTTVLSRLDIRVGKKIRKWIGMFARANLNLVFLPKYKGGLGIASLVTLHRHCRQNFWSKIEHSIDPRVKERFDFMKKQGLACYRPYMKLSQSLEEKKKALSNHNKKPQQPPSTKKLIDQQREEQMLNELKERQFQGSVFRNMQDNCTSWNSKIYRLPPTLAKFACELMLNVYLDKGECCEMATEGQNRRQL